MRRCGAVFFHEAHGDFALVVRAESAASNAIQGDYFSKSKPPIPDVVFPEAKGELIGSSPQRGFQLAVA